MADDMHVSAPRPEPDSIFRRDTPIDPSAGFCPAKGTFHEEQGKCIAPAEENKYDKM